MRATAFALAVLSVAGSVSAAATVKKCTKPAVRKEWRDLKRSEQKAFMDGIKCLYKKPHLKNLHNTGATPTVVPINANSSLYDDIVYTHMDAVNSAHISGRFYPWHRWYIQTFENLMKSECGWKGAVPYWDWTKDSHDIEHATIWGTDPETGLGVFPDESTEYRLTTGAFADLRPVYPSGAHQMTRKFKSLVFSSAEFPWNFTTPWVKVNETMTLAEQNKMINGFRGDFAGFQRYSDGYRGQGLHFAAHIALGGDSEDIGFGPNDPIFWLLHTQIDRIWAKWQDRYPENKFQTAGREIAPFAAGTSVYPHSDPTTAVEEFPLGVGKVVNAKTTIFFTGIGPDTSVGSVLDIHGGLLCYSYAT